MLHAYGCMCETDMHIILQMENLKERHYLEDLRVDRRIILK